jgi:hypothetical protein
MSAEEMTASHHGRYQATFPCSTDLAQIVDLGFETTDQPYADQPYAMLGVRE